jgi:predicted lipoprotein
MKIEVHIHIHNDESELLSLTKEIHSGLKNGEFPMALSPEMQSFVDTVTSALSASGAALANINEDIQRLLANSGGLTAEDKAALVQLTEQIDTLKSNLEQAAAVVPE